MDIAKETSHRIIQFFKLETASAIILVVVTLVALIISNTSLYAPYRELLTTPISVEIGNAGLNKPVLLWINDGLMAIFFCLVAIEIKRKVLANPDIGWGQLTFPATGALGGLLMPAIIYLLVIANHPEYQAGWAIPSATDIAFSLGVLTLLGSRVPSSLKLFLIMLAVIDDLAAIIIIALFYTHELSIFSLGWAGVGVALLVALNRFKVTYVIAYVWVGVFLWVCMVKSGVHATLTGVMVGFALPMGIKDQHGHSPSMRMEHELKFWVNYVHLPIFAFANAGVPLTGVSLALIAEPLPLGIALGLFIGKPLGVSMFVWVATRLRLFTLPADVNWPQFIGVAVLTGIGFTMSLFIGTLAFGEELIIRIRIGVLMGSFMAAVAGFTLLRLSSRKEVIFEPSAS